jgi:hypothetical protein
MMHLFLRALTFLLLLPVQHVLVAQYTITVTRPGSPMLAELDLWNCIITSTSNQPENCYLVGVITEAQLGRMLEMRSAVFALAPGTTQFNTGNYAPLQPEQTVFRDVDFEDHLIRTNTVPNGDYTVCLTLYREAGNAVLAADCDAFKVENVTPPSLLAPDAGGTMCDPFPFFIWTPHRPWDGQQLNYRILIIEVLGGQSEVAAMRNNPAWFVQDGITSPMFQYPITALPFTNGTRYAWSVEVMRGGSRIAVSDIRDFTWKDCTGADTLATAAPAVSINRRRPGLTYYDLSPYPSDEIALVKAGTLNVAVRNDLGQRQVLCRVQGPSGATLRTLPIDLVKGFNYLHLDVSGWGITAARPYTLAFTDVHGRAHTLKFMRTP